ncbi:hypothetical protein D9757_008643 [Collybiopsis confluens]|uniref:Uncharacterized protein n=1 Tax=Collybiopsis confluens TaxID=2823264 RepID=A0A8H5H438_9AGAR|nr:hypothetical protein D9757_008643 [Collybiopsis confluens]
MSDDETQRHPEVSTASNPTDTLDNVDKDESTDPQPGTPNITRDMTGRRSPVVPPSPPSPGFNESGWFILALSFL